MSGIIVIGYDGSEQAGLAIDAAATIVRATEAVVVNVWRPVLIAASPLLASAAPPPSDEGEAALETAAWRTAAEGVERARAAGLRARAETRCGAPADVGRLLAELADDLDADLVVVGRRGVSRVESAVLGSVSNDTIRASRRPVLVVVSPDG